MRIKPYVILGLATVCAGASCAVVITTADPYLIEPRMLWLFWGSLFLTVWGFIGAGFSLVGQRLVRALQIGFVWAVGTLGLLGAAQQGYRDWRLSAGVILATMLVTVVIWIRSKRSNS